jgi:hypothetical protein
MKKKLTIPLRRPYPLLVLGIALFGGGGAFMVDRASSNDRGLVINGIIHLEQPSADVFYAVVGVLSIAFAAISILAIVNLARTERFEIVISQQSITFPNPRLWHPDRQVRVRFDEIVAIRSYTQARHPIIALDTREGTRFLNAKWLSDGWTVAQLCEAVTERWRARTL